MSRALLQAVPASYVDATVAYLSDGREPIDVSVARAQHGALVEGMAWLGYDCAVLGEEGAGPDAVFVEDPVVVHGGVALMLRSAHPGRADEGRRLAPVLARWGLTIQHMEAPAHADGGDVLVLGDDVYVGRSSRTNEEGARAIGEALGLRLHLVTLPGETLHLKCEASPLPGGRVLATRAMAEAMGVEAVIVPDEEAYAANVVARGARALCAAGFPATKKALEEAGFEVRALDLSEMRKGDGSITCLSVRIEG